MGKRKVLIITSIYPLLDEKYEGTKVCHYFSTEWKKMGYDVRVIRLTTYFPRIYYKIGNIFKEIIKAKTGAVVYTKRLSDFQEYVIDGIPVLLLPLYKVFPHVVPSEDRLERLMNIAFEELEKEGFVPDVITGHFQNPQLMGLYLAKKKYPNAKTCMVMHNDGSRLYHLYKKNLAKYMDSVDCWGFRSNAFRLGFEKMYGAKDHTFICFSGIPEEYIISESKKISTPLNKFVFLGSLYKLKRVNDTISALAEVFGKNEFEFNVIGDGAEKNSLKSLANSLEVNKYVHFLGRKNRNEAQKIISNSDVFVMVSAHEAFGLVYIEAMAKGCITIGTKGQGIDGIIKHGVNGFLCESKNPKALAHLIKDIISMPKEQLQIISENALDTAKSMTNAAAAKNYIQNIFNL